MIWKPVMIEAMWKGYRLEIYQGASGEWGAMIFKGGNMTPRARSTKVYSSSLRAKKVAKKLVIIDRKRKTLER